MQFPALFSAVFVKFLLLTYCVYLVNIYFSIFVTYLYVVEFLKNKELN